MFRKRSIFKSFVLAIFVSLLLIGCSNSDDDQGKGEEDGVTTISFWHHLGSGSDEPIEALIEAFETDHPDIKVEAQYIASQGEGQNERLLTSITGGNPPDVAYFDRFEIASWAEQGALEDITELAEKDGITGDLYYPSAWTEAIYEDKLYGLPTATDSRLVFYNKDHFEEVGLDPENPPKTIKELEEAAELLTIKDGKRFERIGFIPWYSQGWFYGWGWSFGGEFYDVDTQEVTATHPQNIEAMQWITDYANKYNVEEISGFTDSQGTEAMDPFLTGQISMKVDGNFRVPSIEKFNPDLNYGVFPMPTPSGEDHITWSGGFSVVIPKGAKNRDAAWEFVKYFGTEKGQKVFNEVRGTFAAIDSINEELGYNEDPILKEFINVLPVSKSRPVMTEGSLYWNELATAVENATRGIRTPEEVLEEVEKKVQEALEN